MYRSIAHRYQIWIWCWLDPVLSSIFKFSLHVCEWEIFYISIYCLLRAIFNWNRGRAQTFSNVSIQMDTVWLSYLFFIISLSHWLIFMRSFESSPIYQWRCWIILKISLFSTSSLYIYMSSSVLVVNSFVSHSSAKERCWDYRSRLVDWFWCCEYPECLPSVQRRSRARTHATQVLYITRLI